MTALKPIEWRDVRGVASKTYPTNRVCAHPECSELVQLRPDGTPTVHHIFPRSQINSSSYFVEIVDEPDGSGATHSTIIPHAVGLCGSGTTGHHGDVEEHRAWIKLEGGHFNWYDRVDRVEYDADGRPWDLGLWLPLGGLNPQPGSVEGKPKRKKRAKQPARPGQMFSCRVPKDEAENGLEVLNELLDANRDRLAEQMGWTDSVPNYFVLIAVLAEGLQ